MSATTERVRLAARDRHANRVSGPEFDHWLDEHDREVAAKAWDEGAYAAFDCGTRREILAGNPYRDAQAVTADGRD